MSVNTTNVESNDYFNLFDTMINTNKLKIITIKTNMDRYIVDTYNDFRKTCNLPIYLDYMLSSLIKSFPILNFDIDGIVNLLTKFHELSLHPFMFKPLFINIIHSTFINQIAKFQLNSNSQYSQYSQYSQSSVAQFDYSLLNSVEFEVNLLFDQFNKIFDDIDTKFVEKENNIGYNELSSFGDREFNSFFSSIAIGSNKTFNKKTILNVFIIYLQRFSQINIEDIIKSLNFNFEDVINFKEIKLNK